MKEKRVYFPSLVSTSERVKEYISGGENVVICADEQTGGKGTKGRSFSSQKGGVYFTRLTFLNGVSARDAHKIVENVAVGVCKTLERYGLSPKIKWPNDIFLGEKKVCGILTENSLSGDQIRFSCVGVGLNVKNELPKELAQIATTMQEHCKEILDLIAVRERLIKDTAQNYAHEEYEKRLFTDVDCVVLFGEEKIPARILGVGGDGKLIVETATGTRAFSSAEVSLRDAEKPNA